MPVSSEATVFYRVRQAILNGTWAPGTRLAPASLAALFDSSTTVVRESLSRLVGDHLVITRPNRGFFIPYLSLQEFQDITELRCATEALGVRLALERGDLQWENTLIAAHHTMVKTPRRVAKNASSVSDDWFQAHRAFHQSLLAACGCEPLLRQANSLALSTDLYRRWAAPTPLASQRDVEAEHQQLLEAALDRDTQRLTTLLHTHYRKTTEILVKAGLLPQAVER